MARRHYKQKSMKKRSVTELTSRCDGTARAARPFLTCCERKFRVGHFDRTELTRLNWCNIAITLIDGKSNLLRNNHSRSIMESRSNPPTLPGG